MRNMVSESKLKRGCGAVNGRVNLRPSLPGKCQGSASTAASQQSGRQQYRTTYLSSSMFDDGSMSAPTNHHICVAPVRARETSTKAEEWDVLGLGQAMVDFSATVDESMLKSLNVPKGGRRVITVGERAQIMEMLEGYDSQVSAGGSLANTLVGLGQLTAAQQRASHSIVHSSSHTLSISSNSRHSQGVRIAMTGCVGGSDALGEFARAQLQAGSVNVVGPGPSGHATGVVMVFSTPDAQRSFLSSFSSEDSIQLSEELKQTAACARLLLIEGYLWELPGAAVAIPALVRHAREVGTLVALTAGDAGVVERHGAKVLEAIASGVDVWFGNEAEAAALVQHLNRQQQAERQLQQQLQDAAQQQQHEQLGWAADDDERDFTVMQLEHCGSSSANNSNHCTADSAALAHHQPQLLNGQEAALQLASICPMVVVTDGSRGSYITALGELVVVPPYWSPTVPVDTCGAGDAYAAGLLYGFLLGLDLHGMGSLAAKTASAVISKHGPQLTPEDADWVVAGLVKKQHQRGMAAAVGMLPAAGGGRCALEQGASAITGAGAVTTAAPGFDVTDAFNNAGSNASRSIDWLDSVL